ncbi:MAG TPA: spermidine synthase [Sulfuricurvum sp.]|nr:MAG: spermidine synthase [Campylobacterales bacterium 16-40-21]OZA03106.1 MAG: spermidine synthase [Sulfuricurvum sp. 17-40-25]HQS67094.1 spermidine synthase [Sulfuricurvum sp.]HQT36750.1 spermidine synthase [Sulfuricurvum sp.]
MKTFVYPEMMVHVSMCTHKLPTSVLLASDNRDLLMNELARYKESTVTTVGSSDLLESFRNADENSADVIMVDALTSDSVVIAHIGRILKDDGVLVMKHPSLDDVSANKPLMEALGNYFKIIMPYRLEDGSTLLLSSKEYHPTADVILQRTDLLEGHQYYNCDVHPAAFAMPQYVRENYRGFARN